ETEWCFKPCEQLGGDAFGYHWIDPDHLSIYLLDVFGHGVGATLLSVSVLNAIRAGSLAGVGFRRAGEVLTGLNRAFRKDHQNNLFFSIWYGVYQVSLRQLRFATGGHPPALLLARSTSGDVVPRSLCTEAPAVGCVEEARYVDAVEEISPGSRLL